MVTVAGEVVGVIDVVLRHPDSVTVACGLFLLEPRVRRAGLGTALAADLLERARQEAMHAVTVTWPAGQSDATSFAARVGFVTDDTPARTELVRASLSL